MDIIHVGLPIQCVEATFIGLYCTSELKNFIRIPLSFKSCFEDGSHKHLVLVLKSNTTGKWGAIGISRRADLMYKPLAYDSLYDLLLDYKRSYENNFHRLLNAYFGYPFLTNEMNSNGHESNTNTNMNTNQQDRQDSAETNGKYNRERSVKWKEMKLKIPTGGMYEIPTGDANSNTSGSGSSSAENNNSTLSIEFIKLKEQCDLYAAYCDMLNTTVEE